MLFFVISIGKIGPKGKERQNIAQTEIERLYVLLISFSIITVIPEPGGRGPLQLTLFQKGPVGGRFSQPLLLAPPFFTFRHHWSHTS